MPGMVSRWRAGSQTISGPEGGRVRCRVRSALALLADSLGEDDRRTGEPEVLAEATLDVALVARVELAGGEEHERGRRGGGLRREHDLGLLAAADRVRVLGDQPAE